MNSFNILKNKLRFKLADSAVIFFHLINHQQALGTDGGNHLPDSLQNETEKQAHYGFTFFTLVFVQITQANLTQVMLLIFPPLDRTWQTVSPCLHM